MIRKISAHLGIKLFIFLTIIIILAVVPLSFTALHALILYGNEASESNEGQIRFQAISYLKKITQERAEKYQKYFDQIATSAALLGRQASTIYSDISFYAKKPLYTQYFIRLDKNNIWISDITDPVTSLFWGAPKIGPKVREEMQAMTHMAPLFEQVLKDNPDAIASHTIAISGYGQYTSTTIDNKKALFELPPASVFDLRNSEPVTLFSKSESILESVSWTDIYKDDVTDEFMLTVSSPIYDKNKELKGITGIDLPLDTLIRETLSYNKKWGKSIIQFSFLLDDKGKIIALPKEYYQLLGLRDDHSKLSQFSEKRDILLSNSTNEDVKEAAKSLLVKDNFFTELHLKPDNYFIVSSRMAKQGWIFGVAVKESDILFSVEESRKSLDTTVKTLIKQGGLVTLFSVLSALFILFMLIKYLITPLRNLARATQRVASGDLTVRSPVTTSDEAGVLSKSFNSMVEQLQLIQEEQERYAESLKLEVIRRNLELVSKKKELENAVDLLKKEVDRRQIISEALRNSQQQYYDTLESSSAGIYIIEEGVFTYVNNTFATSLFGTTKDELVGTDPLGLVSEEDRELAEANMQLRLQGIDVPPYTIQFVRKNGSVFYGEAWSRISTWQDKKVIVGTITDVSYIKHNEEKLQIQDRQLQKSLDEKEILLKEVYHRTKNNMLVIISMLDLQAQDIEDKRLKLIFRETESRIRTMALVHEKLYRSQNLSEIDMGNYLVEAAKSLLDTMVIGDKITLKTDIEPIPIDIDYAVPLGLVINEIITNSIKYAFPEKRKGVIKICVSHSVDDNILLIVSDDGIGLPVDIDLENNTSFGLGIIITSLVKMQLKGKVDVDCENGTRYHITFPKPKAAKRI